MIGEKSAPRDAPSARPELGSGVVVEAPRDPRGLWIISRDGVPAARVSAEVAAAARQFTGRDDAAGVARALGAPWTEAEVIEIARRLHDSGLLRAVGGRTSARRKSAGPFRFRPPLTLQWSWGDPARIFAALRPATRAVLGAPGLVAATVLIALAVGAAVRDHARIAAVLSSPLDLVVVPVILAALVLTTLAHEAGHGAVLSAFGGSPRRIGAMLFYLAPAFFCDVTDGWRLARRRERVAVALAGPAVHLLCAALAILVAAFVEPPGAHAALVLYALSCLAIAVLNLLPFVQLDGYLALMAALDRPHLRRQAIATTGAALSTVLFGTPPPPAPPATAPPTAAATRGWTIAYGLGCAVFPVVLVGWVLYRAAETFGGVGVVALLVYAAMLVLVAVVVVRAVARGIRRLRRAGASPARSALTAALAAAAGSGILLVPVPIVEQTGVVVQGSEVRLVLPPGQATPQPGAPVILESSGILVRRPAGTAVVADAPPESAKVDIAALVPLRATGVTTEALTVRLVDVEAHASLPSFGVATIDHGATRPWGAWLWHEYLIDPFRSLVPKGETS